METATAPKNETAQSAPTKQNAVAVLQPPRLPYHPAIEERFGVDKASWKALTEAIYPSAKTTDSVVMALSYCRARNLDPFKKPVHIVPMWSSAAGGYVETVWPGISELRTTAFRTGQYAGCDETEFGQSIERTFKGKVKERGEWKEKELTITFPEWARMTVYRDLNGVRCKFVGPKVRWLEAYATAGNSDIPNEMWEVRTEGQLEKCAEAAALRKAFPEELGNMLVAEEMEGRRLIEGQAGQPSQNASGGTKPSLNAALDNLAQTPSPSTAQTDVVDADYVDSEDTHSAEAEAAPASSHVPNGTGAALLSKAELLASIDKIESKLGALQWARDHQAALDKLAKKDRAQVDAAFQVQQDGLPE